MEREESRSTEGCENDGRQRQHDPPTWRRGKTAQFRHKGAHGGKKRPTQTNGTARRPAAPRPTRAQWTGPRMSTDANSLSGQMGRPQAKGQAWIGKQPRAKGRL